MKLKIFLTSALSFCLSMALGFVLGSWALGIGLFALGVAFQFLNPVGAAAYLICGTIAASQAPDCNNPLNGGADDVLYLYNFADVATVSLNVSNTMICEEIVMSGVATGFTITGQNFSNQPRWRMVKGPFQNQFEHEIELLIFNYTGAVKKELLAYAGAKLMAVVQHNFKGANGAAAFHLYGSGSGLYCEIMEQDANSDIQGAVRVMFKSNEKALEGKPPLAVFDTDYATTLAMIEGTV